MKTLENGEQKETLEVICTKANSSGKFNTNSYKYSAGINTPCFSLGKSI